MNPIKVSRKVKAAAAAKGLPCVPGRVVKKRGQQFIQLTGPAGRLIPIVGVAADGVWSPTSMFAGLGII